MSSFETGPSAVTITATCAGKTFEHHERTEFVDGTEPADFGRWRCPACLMEGHVDEVLRRLVDLLPLLYKLKGEHLDHDVVVLVPSDATPAVIGECFGYEVRRVQGIDRPMVALPGGP